MEIEMVGAEFFLLIGRFVAIIAVVVKDIFKRKALVPGRKRSKSNRAASEHGRVPQHRAPSPWMTAAP